MAQEGKTSRTTIKSEGFKDREIVFETHQLSWSCSEIRNISSATAFPAWPLRRRRSDWGLHALLGSQLSWAAHRLRENIALAVKLTKSSCGSVAGAAKAAHTSSLADTLFLRTCASSFATPPPV